MDDPHENTVLRYPEECRGKGFHLQRLRAEDVSEDYVAWLHDPEVIRYLQVRFEPRDIESVRKFVAGFDHRDRFIFAIYDSAVNRHIGNMTLRVNPHHLWANMGYLIGEKSYWRTNATMEACRLLLDFAFYRRKVRKILECTTEDHISSNFNFRRLGFTFAAKIPDLYWGGDKYIAATYWTLDAGQWAENRVRFVEEHASPQP